MCILGNVDIMDEKYSDAEKWLDKALAEKYGKTLDRMKTQEKIELFNKIKVFT